MIKSGEGDEEDDDDNSNGFHPSVSYYRASEFTKKIHFILWEMTVVKQEAEAAKAVVEKKNLVFLPMMNRKKKRNVGHFILSSSLEPRLAQEKKNYNFFKLLFSVVASGINRLKDRHTYKTDRSTDRQTRQIDRLTDRGGRRGYVEGGEKDRRSRHTWGGS